MRLKELEEWWDKARMASKKDREKFERANILNSLNYIPKEREWE